MTVYITCPECNTRFDMTGKIPDNRESNIACPVCHADIEIHPKNRFFYTTYQVSIRPKKED